MATIALEPTRSRSHHATGAPPRQESPAGPIRIVVADGQKLFLVGLRAVITASEDMRVIGEASTGEALVEMADRTRPDVALIDLRLTGGDGLWSVRELARRSPRTKAVVIALPHDQHALVQALDAGAVGCFLKTIDPRDIPAAIRQTVAGTVVAPSAGIMPRWAGLRADSTPMLTRREVEILRLVADGASNEEIATGLWVTRATVKFHLSNAYRKLGARNRTEASRMALRMGIVDHGLDGDAD